MGEGELGMGGGVVGGSDCDGGALGGGVLGLWGVWER